VARIKKKEGGIMKGLLAYTVIGLFLACATGLSLAADYYYNASEDCNTEGPPYNREYKKGPAIPTRVVLDQGSRYIEGMGFAPCVEGKKTIVPVISKSRDWCCEDMSDAEIEMHYKNVNAIEPAAGH